MAPAPPVPEGAHGLYGTAGAAVPCGSFWKGEGMGDHSRHQDEEGQGVYLGHNKSRLNKPFSRFLADGGKGTKATIVRGGPGWY